MLPILPSASGRLAFNISTMDGDNWTAARPTRGATDSEARLGNTSPINPPPSTDPLRRRSHCLLTEFITSQEPAATDCPASHHLHPLAPHRPSSPALPSGPTSAYPPTTTHQQPTMAAARYKQVGDDMFKKADKLNSELFSLTYGAMVVQLIKDYEDYNEVNTQLDKM